MKVKQEKYCKDCKHFIGGGDWNLCCRKPPDEDTYGWLCYEWSAACKNFEEKIE